MIKRLVRMSFKKDQIPHFLSIFNGSKEQIRQFDGCEYLSLHRDATDKSTYYTLSHWVSEEHLNAYRKSELFRKTWARTKVLFSDKPQAYSLEEEQELK